jgi:hypothetical protein
MSPHIFKYVVHDMEFLEIDTFLFTVSEVKSLPSGKGTNQLITDGVATARDKFITGGINAPYTMPLC